jgi:VCBS repeat-containing protein
LGNDSDADSDPLTAVLDTDVTSGSLTLNSNGSFIYTPNGNFCGNASFTYHANDGQADSAPVTVTLTVTCAPDAPVAVDDGYATDQDTPLTVPAPGILGNDNDVDGDPLTAALDAGVLTGTLDFNPNGSFSYTPLAGWSGTVTFSYHANDGALDSNTAVVTIVVGGANSAPVAVDDNFTVQFNSSNNTLAILANDSDPDGDTLTITNVSDPANGTATISGDNVIYTPKAGFTGQDTFIYTISDGVLTDTAMVTINVQAEGTLNLYLPLILTP